MARRWVAVVALLVLQAEPGSALEPGKKLAQYVRASWTVEDGLPQSTVLGITQTTDGFIWAATQEGFVRFDGNEFKTYDKSEYPEIVSTIAVAMRGTRDGNLYVGTINGLIRLRGEKLEVFTTTSGLPNNNITALLEGADGALWIGTSSGLARLSGNSITPIGADQLVHQTITTIAETKDGTLWVGTPGGLFSLRGGGLIQHALQFPVQPVQALQASRDGSLWIGTEKDGLFRYADGTFSKQAHGARLHSSRLNALYEDSRGTLWIATHDRGFGRLRNNDVDFDNDTEIADEVSTFFEDREGNLWIGRISGGLTRLTDGVVVSFSRTEGISNDDVKTITAERDGTIWVGTKSGIEPLEKDRPVRRQLKRPLSSSHVLSAYAARDGNIWVGTADAGLNRISPNGTVTMYSTKDGLPADAILALYEDQRGAMWVGTSSGLTRIVNGKIDPGRLPLTVSGDSISAVIQGRDGSIWVGTHERGLVRIAGDSATTYNVRNGLSSDFVVAIHEDASGTLWIGTAAGGLNRFKDGKLAAIGSRHGLQDDSVFSILEDGEGNLWMSCNKGVFRARIADLNAVADGQRRTLQSVIYGRADGMKSREGNGGHQPVAWKTPDGRLWFSTTGGVAMIDPRKVLPSSPVPRVIIGEVYADENPVPRDKPIPAGSRTLEIRYTSPTFKTPDKMRFQYTLEGFDTWTEPVTRRAAYYTNVPPGRYRFHVRAINGEGVITPQSTIGITVEPFFYQTPLFWALVAIALLAAAWSAHQWRIRLIRASAERFKLMFDRNLAGVYRATINGRILDCNQAGLRILGVSSVEELNQSTIFDRYVNPADAEELLRRVREDGAVSGVETSLRRTDGTPIWVLQNVSLARSNGQEILEATIIDITDRKNAEEQIRYQAYHDALTDLPNRALFKERLSLALAHAQRRSRQVAVLFLDLDRFKLINDTLGHTVGDHLLQGVGERLRECVREEDSVARVGGDEFTVLLMDLRRAADAMVVARKILDVVAQPITVDGHELFVTCSIGISMSPADGEDAETLLKNADNALYRAKEAGKNNYQLCTPSMTQLAAERLSLENALRQAIDRNEFVVLYQPQVDVRTRRVTAVEALLRWNRPGKGIVPPSDFIAAAEESRLIVPIGDVVLDEAARQARMWDASPPVRIAVNVSAAQFQQRHLVRAVRDVVEQWKIDPRRLEIEITESTAMQNPAATAEILQELKGLGVSVVIDDFGIGHSSLNYLKRFPIDGLKIDRTFVQDMTSDASDAGIVAAIIAMAKALNLRVTAEGVETEQQMEILESYGCSTVQGYLLSRPVTAEAMSKLLRDGVVIAPADIAHSA